MLYARQLGWLCAVPDKAKVSRMEAIQNNMVERQERVISNLPEDKNIVIPVATSEVNLPEIDPAYDYMKRLFSLSGQAMSTGMGLSSLSWQELSAFRQENKLEVTAWEVELLKRMSDAYCAEYSRASDPSRPAPYSPPRDNEAENEEEALLAKALRIRESLSLFKRS